ncbi:hypothetical protein UFOVP653_55 [uncultured Caudovirales phage]|uniref:Uncharacterized protein n=1 Tax=uncultured Caudovirales phage TaxID=2100421 RepID=A0A6J5NCT9_9CAUD|nr:hypothetical protein UFOVP653_55 [uncultured Caudovirales phage]
MAIIINGNNTPTAGGVAHGNGTELAFGASGSTGQVCISNGFSAPSFSTVLQADEANQGVGVGIAPDGTQWVTIAAGTSTKGSLELVGGTLMTTPNGGAMEYDGTNLSFTNDNISLRGYVPATQLFRLTANGAAIGPAIANFYGANSAINLAAGGIYKLTAYMYFTKTTAGTVVVTITSSSAPTSVSGILQTGAIAGGALIGAANQASIFNSALAAAAFGATGSLTTAVNHAIIVEAIYVANAATNVRFNVTSSAGTVTPLAQSYYTVTRLPANNSGNFVA